MKFCLFSEFTKKVSHDYSEGQSESETQNGSAFALPSHVGEVPVEPVVAIDLQLLFHRLLIIANNSDCSVDEIFQSY